MSSRRVVWYDFDDFRLETETQRLLKDGAQVPLSAKTFQTLLILVERAGTIVEKDEIYKRLWADSFVEEGNLTQQIYVLRKTLGQTYVETVARHGYRFTAEVKVVNAEISIDNQNAVAKTIEVNRGNSADVIDKPAVDRKLRSNGGSPLNNSYFSTDKTWPDDTRNGPLSSDAQARTTKPQPRSRFVLYAAIAAITVGIGLFAYFSRALIAPADTISKGEIRSLAILPFNTIGGESSDDQLGLGMTDAVITRLSKLKQIPVRPTSAVFRFVGTETLPETAGRDLQVDAVLEGTVQRGGDWVRVSVRLIKVETGETIWAEKFDGEHTHIFKIQDTISAKLVDSLALNLSPGREQNIDKRATDNLEAYQAYTLGIYFWNKRTKEALLKAEQYFTRAIDLDPNYAQAYAGLADTYNMLAYNRFVPLSEVGEKAKAAALKAVELDDMIAESHMALAQVQFAYEKNNEAGLRALERAIELSPYHATARVRYGWRMVGENRLEDAEREMRLAQEYDPLSPTHNVALCNVLLFARKYDEAAKFCQHALEIDRGIPGGRISLAEVYLSTGRNQQAFEVATEETVANPNDLYAQTFLAYVQARIGNIKAATESADRLSRHAERSPFIYVDLVLTNYVIGRKDIALTLLKKAISENAVTRINHAFDPKFDAIKADPQFSELILRDHSKGNLPLRKPAA